MKQLFGSIAILLSYLLIKETIDRMSNVMKGIRILI